MNHRVRTAASRIALLLAVPFTASCAAAPQNEPADIVLRNGRIVTVDEARPEAEAVAIRGHTIVAVGTDAEIARHVGRATRVIDLGGRLAIPGFIEGHGHFMGVGQAKMNLDLMSVRNWDEVVRMVATATRDAKRDAWIVGRGWHQEKWDVVPEPNVDGVPLHTSLDSVSLNNPVFLTHASGHAAFANRRALELAGIDRDTPDPEGGTIVKDARGEPTGLLRETAQGLVARARAAAEQGRTPQDRAEEARRMAQLAAAEALSHGVTSFHDAGTGFETIDFLRQLEARDELPVRLYVMIRAPNEELATRLPAYHMPATENDYLVVRSIKVSIDGALGPHGAWLLEPYSDMPSSRGLALVTPESVARTAELALQHGFQLNVHAIGDRANREVLDIYERAFGGRDTEDRRWRIEHAQHLHPSDIDRFAALRVIPAMQGVHATSDGPWIPRRLGEQRAREGAYVWRQLIESGAIIANGTDAPVEHISPIMSFFSSVSRRMDNGEVFYGEQRMTREEALRSYTLNNAYAEFAEDAKGSITPGKLADIVVLSRDIMRVAEDSIPGTVVDYTIVGGKVRFER
jgi:predicted amidohydrolase YtcJ